MTGVILSIIVQSIICAFLIYNRQKNSFFILHIYVLVICVDFIHELFIYNYFKQDAAYLDIMPGSFRFLKGPLLFLFTRQYIGKPIPQKWLVLLFLPFIISLATNLSLIGNLILHHDLNNKLLAIYHHQILYFYFYYWVGFISISTYQLIRYGDRKDPLYKWYLIFLLYLLSTIVSYYLAQQFGGDKILLRSIYNYLFFVQFAMLIHMNLKSKIATLPPSIIEPSSIRDKYEHSNLTQDDLQIISKKIINYLDGTLDYQSEDFSLQHLSEKIGVSKHHISQTITDNLQTTFYELINNYRLSLFLRKLEADPKQNLANLCYEVGFRSRTTFYKYFKSKTGLTPSEYKGTRKQLPTSLDI